MVLLDHTHFDDAYRVTFAVNCSSLRGSQTHLQHVDSPNRIGVSGPVEILTPALPDHPVTLRYRQAAIGVGRRIVAGNYSEKTYDDFGALGARHLSTHSRCRVNRGISRSSKGGGVVQIVGSQRSVFSFLAVNIVVNGGGEAGTKSSHWIWRARVRDHRPQLFCSRESWERGTDSYHVRFPTNLRERVACRANGVRQGLRYPAPASPTLINLLMRILRLRRWHWSEMIGCGMPGVGNLCTKVITPTPWFVKLIGPERQLTAACRV